MISLKGQRNTEFAILPCGSVASNTGVIVTLATLEVVKSGKAVALSFPALIHEVKRQLKLAESFKHLIVVDGCKNKCAKKLAEHLRLMYEAYLNLADLEIKKLGPFSSNEYGEEDVKLVKKVLLDIIEEIEWFGALHPLSGRNTPISSFHRSLPALLSDFTLAIPVCC